MVTAILTGCQKEQATLGTSEIEVDIAARVRAFVERTRTEDQTKDNSIISLDSALWYIEAGLNFSLAQAWRECSDYYVDSAQTFIACSTNEISASRATEAYNSLAATINAKTSSDSSHLIVADVNFVPSSGGLTAFVMLQFCSGYDKSLNTTFAQPFYFGNGDWWGTTTTNCGCGTNSGGAGDCADRQITNRINLALPAPQPDCFYTDVESRGIEWYLPVTFNYSYNQFPTGIAATPYKVFTCFSEFTCLQQNGNCLSPAKLAFYTQSGWDLMQQLKPTNKVSTGANFEDISPTCGGSCYYSRHMAAFFYARKSCR